MYLNLGQSVVVPYGEILGIFDLDNTSWAYKTREFLERAEKEGRAFWLTDDLPRSFVLTGDRGGRARIYLSSLSPSALLNRVERNIFE